MRSFAVVCFACVLLHGTLAAQEGRAAAALERGSTGIGSRISLFFGGLSGFKSGIEVGYSKLGRSEEVKYLRGAVAGDGIQRTITSARLLHATVVARKQWPVLDRGLQFYAVGGTGVYMGQTSTERLFALPSGAGFLAPGVRSSSRDWQFGANIGAGVAFKRAGWPGAIDLDARVHVLPFSNGFGPRALMTLSAGLSFF
jgi:hypothetical protein